MAIRTAWQDLYGIQMDTGATLATHLAGSPTYDAASDIGILGDGTANGKFALPLTSHPNYKAPTGSVDARQARGIAERHAREYNIVQTGDPVEFTLDMNGNAYNISAFIALLLQNGVSEAATVNTNGANLLTGIPYTLADVNNYAYLSRSLQPVGGGKSIDALIKGAICSGLQITGQQGAVLQIQPTIRAASWEQADLSAVAGPTDNLANSFSDIVPLKFQDSTIAFYDEYTNPGTPVWVEVYTPNISLNIVNNAIFNFYNNNKASVAILDNLEVTGSIEVPFSQDAVGDNYMIQRFLSGEPVKIAWFWGQSGDTKDIANDYTLVDGASTPGPFDRYKNDTVATNPLNFVSFIFNAKVNDYDFAGDNELMTTANFEAATDVDDQAITVKALYDSTKLTRIP